MTSMNITISIPPNIPRIIPYIPRPVRCPPPLNLVIGPSSVNLPAMTQHVLRSGTRYTHDTEYMPRKHRLYLAFNQCYREYVQRKVIPEASRKRLDEIKVSGFDFDKLVVQRELPGKIELWDGRVVFNVSTLFPHATAITWVARHIDMQDVNEMFDSGTGARKIHFSRPS